MIHGKSGCASKLTIGVKTTSRPGVKRWHWVWEPIWMTKVGCRGREM